ncbi:MAG: DUF4836 family protein, partial [Muribaculaceae bacterium]|nr:DUF4836 family protein [Muribaculaceae bacterium]
FIPIRSITAYFAAIAIVITSLLTSCSGNNADVSELLATVPADATAVIAVNVKSLVEKSGSKIDGSKIVPGDDIKQFLKNNASTPDEKRIIRNILDGESGIDPTVAVIFLEETELYFTGFLANPDKFKEFMAKEYEGSFSESNGISTLSNVALKGNQFWINNSKTRNDIDPEQITRFLALDDKLSFLSNSYSKKLSDFSNDIDGWGNLSSLYNASDMSFQEKAMAGLALAGLFSDAQDISFHANFEKGKLVTGLNILNSKGLPAQFNLPTDRIDVGMVKNLSESGDIIVAMAISPKLVEQLQNDFGDKNIPGLGMLMPALSALDGTCVVEGGENGFKGAFSTKGDATAALSDLLSQLSKATVSKDGKFLRFQQGDVKGKILNADVADRFKGAMIAAVVSDKMNSREELKGMPLQDVFMALIPADGSMQLEVTVNSTNSKENFLLSFIKAK